jgi:hypothetical protein
MGRQQPNVGLSRRSPLWKLPLARFAAPPGILQDDAPPMIIDDGPFLDFIDASEAAQADVIVIQAAVPDAWRLNRCR